VKIRILDALNSATSSDSVVCDVNLANCPKMNGKAIGDVCVFGMADHLKMRGRAIAVVRR
jgi:hypothetical protein